MAFDNGDTRPGPGFGSLAVSFLKGVAFSPGVMVKSLVSTNIVTESRRTWGMIQEARTAYRGVNSWDEYVTIRSMRHKQDINYIKAWWNAGDDNQRAYRLGVIGGTIALSAAGPKAVPKMQSVAKIKTPDELAAIASQIKNAPDVHGNQHKNQVIAVGTDACGMLVAACNTSSWFSRGQRAMMERMGITWAPARTVQRDPLHAEENPLGAMPNPTGIGTSRKVPCLERCNPLLSKFGIPWATSSE